MWLHGLIALGEYIITNVFSFKTTTALSSISIFICPKLFLKTSQWSRYYSKVFENIFETFP
jgi:hypothetical protein